MEKIHSGSANSGLVGRRLSNADKVVIMWALDSLADNSMAYVKTVRQVIERQTAPPAPGGGASLVVSRIAHAIRISRGIEPEFVVWMSVDQDLFVKGVVKTMLGLCVEKWHNSPLTPSGGKANRFFEEYVACGRVLDRWMLTIK